MLSGVLPSRTLAGFAAAHLGWQEMFWLAAPLALGVAGLMAVLLPRNHPHLAIGYGEALASVVRLWRQKAALQRATLVQAALFGVIGAAGVMAAPLAGRIADRHGPALVIGAGALLAVLSWLVFGLWGALPGLVLGVVVLDFGVQSALVANQGIVFALQPDARNRPNTVFVTVMFVGRTARSAGATFAWSLAGWPAICGFGAALAVAALVFEGGGRFHGTPRTPALCGQAVKAAMPVGLRRPCRIGALPTSFPAPRHRMEGRD